MSFLDGRWIFDLYTLNFLDRIAEGLHCVGLFEIFNSKNFEQLCSSSGCVNLVQLIISSSNAQGTKNEFLIKSLLGV